LRPIVAKVKAAILAGESFAEALSKHPDLFSAMYVALVRVGEASGTLPQLLELLAEERSRADRVRRKLTEALQYPAFLLFAAGGVLVFFLMFVLPQFSAVLRDFGAKTDSLVGWFLDLSDFLRAHATATGLSSALSLLACWLVLRQPAARRT